MKTALFGLSLLVAFSLASASPGVAPSVAPPGNSSAAELPFVAGWGATSDQDGNCLFHVELDALKITVPGSDRAHDLSAENNMLNAPRVTQKARGDFSVQVCVDGTFEPGEESTQPGRTGYTGGVLVVFGDQKNYVTLARAALQTGGIERMGYANFEIRVNGENLRFGTTGDRPITTNAPVFLRLEKKGRKINAFVSDDGVKWDDMGAKDLPDSWPDEMEVGVAAVSTSKKPFAPIFRGFHVKQASAESETSADVPAEKASDPSKPVADKPANSDK